MSEDLYINHNSFFCSNILAQNINYSTDSLLASKPKIFVSEGGDIVWENFPVFSEHRETILLIYQKYSCCFSFQTELRAIQVKNSSIIQKIILTPDDGLPNFSDEQKLRIIHRVDSMLQRQVYYSMTEIDSFCIEKTILPSEYYINFEWNRIKLRSEKFELPKMTLPAS